MPKPQTATEATGVARRVRRVSKPAILVVGASTGGPQALTILVARLVPAIPQMPICVTLHMPADLMSVIAAHVARTCGVETRVVRSTQALETGVVYFAPGNQHLEFRRRNAAGVDLQLSPGAPRESCKPAIDVMFASAATCFGPRALAIVLSGMGEDGLAGARAIVAAGGSVIVQDRESSAVWGMPGAVAKAELATAMLTPAAIGEEVVRRIGLSVCSA